MCQAVSAPGWHHESRTRIRCGRIYFDRLPSLHSRCDLRVMASLSDWIICPITSLNLSGLFCDEVSVRNLVVSYRGDND